MTYHIIDAATRKDLEERVNTFIEMKKDCLGQRWRAEGPFTYIEHERVAQVVIEVKP